MQDRSLVDAYNDYCCGPRLLGNVELVPRPSTKRRWRRGARTIASMAVAAATVAAVVVVLPSASQAASSTSSSTSVPPPPNTIHHARTIGHILTPHVIPDTCTPGAPLPSPSINTLAYLAEPSSNEVQAVDEETGALYGTPITVGTSPKGAAYWRPVTSSSTDPEVVVSNSGSNSVTLIDAVTQGVVASITLPSSSAPTSVGTSPAARFGLVVDPGTGKVSVINLQSNTDQGEISLTSTANALSSIAVSASGTYAYVTDPSEHKVFVLDRTPGTSPYWGLYSTYTNSSYDPTGIATDLSTSSSSTLLVGNAQSSSGSLLDFSDASGSLSSPTLLLTFTTQVPGAISLNPGASVGYVAMTGTKYYKDVPIASPSSTVQYTAPSAFTALGTLGLSADGSTLLLADTGGGSVQEWSTTALANTNSTAADSAVAAIAPALATQNSWNAYVAVGSNVDVVNTGTDTIAQTIADTNGPDQVAASPDGRYVYVANSSTVTVIQTSLVGTPTNPVVDTITGIQGSEPNTPALGAIAVSPSGDSVLVSDFANGAVYVIDTNQADSSTYRTVVNRIGLLGGTHSTVVQTDGGLGFSADGLYAYVPEVGVSLDTYDGITVLKLASATTTGYAYDATNEALTQGGTTMIIPASIAVDPNGESVYVVGTDTAKEPVWGLYKLPIGTNGQIGNGSSTIAPVWTGLDGAGVAFSPEDDSAFVSDTGSFSLSSVSEAAATTNWSSATGGWSGQVAVSPDGEYVAVGTNYFCDYGENQLDFFDGGSGASLANVALSSIPLGVAFAPQSSPQPITTNELSGNASNPAESAVSSGMNDVVAAGTPSDAPGVSAGVDTATGAYSLSVDSLSVPDIGIGLDQTVTYDSDRATVAGVLGKGWDSTYGVTATQISHSASTNPCAIVVTQSDGATVMFHPSTQGPFPTSCPTAGYQAPGWAQATMTFQSSCNGTDSCYVMTLDGMTKYSIDETNGELVKIADLNGNAVTITWGSHTACSGATTGEPCQVTAPDGIRTLTYSYLSGGTGACPSWTATCVIVTDPLGRTARYNLSSASQLSSIVLSNGSANAWTVFSYSGTSTNLLTNWWDPLNNTNHSSNTTYATDVTYASGRVTEVTGPPIASVAPLSTTNVTPATTFTYDDVDTATGDGTVLVDNPDFNQSNYEPGASQTLDTYANFELVSSVVGYGPVTAYYNGSTAPVVPVNPSVSGVPMRDDLNLMPSESMGALAGSTVPPVGSQGSQYDSDVTMTNYDAHGNVLSTTDPSGDTTTSTYNGLNEAVSSTDGLGNVTKSTYSSTGLLLTTTPPANGTGGVAVTSNYYNSNGTLCASRDADQTAAYGVLSSCVTAGSNATTYTYDSSGDITLTTATDSSTQTSTTQAVFDADGNTCATLSPDGYAITGDRLSSCPSAGAPYATVTLSRDVFESPTKTVSSLSVVGTNTYATSYTCTDGNGNTVATVGPMGSFSSCSSLSPTTSVDASFNTFDTNGDQVQSISPLAASGTQGPTTTSQLDADGTDVLDLSSQGYAVWEANHSATLTGYETGMLMDDQGNTVASAPEADTSSTCVDNPTDPCPDDSVTTYDNQGQDVNDASAGNGESGSTTPTASATVNNPDSTAGGTIGEVGGGTGVQETTQSTYDANQAATNQVNEHWTGSAWVTDSATTTAYAPDGSTCWTAPTDTASPTCSSPPTGEATIDDVDLDGNVLAEVGPGGAGAIGTTGHCNPLDAVATAYSINTSELCAFTTYHAYDEAGRLTETIEPSTSSLSTAYVTAGITTTYSYDPSGNQTSEINPAGNTVSSTYDAASRLVGITYSDVGTTNCTVSSTSYDTCYGYNADGTRSQMVDSTGTTSYTYDDAKNVVSVTDSNGNTVTYGYNAFGQESCISYPGFASGDSCVNNPDNGTNTIDPGEVWYTYDGEGRMSSLVDWNGDAFTYGYDCTGDVAWLAETPSTQIPTVAPCQGSSGSVPTSPSPSASGTTFVITNFSYSSGGSGGLLTSQVTSALTHSGTASLLEFNSHVYDDNNNLTSTSPTVNGTTKTADTYGYDVTQQRVTSGPEPSGWSTGYDYVNSTSSPFSSEGTVDQMGMDVQPAASSAFTGSEYAGNGELCWEAQGSSGMPPVTSTSSPCGAPTSPLGYESFSYNSSGDLLGTAPHSGYGTSSSMTWNPDRGTLSCSNPVGSTCVGPSPSQSSAAAYTYDADGLRTQSTTWNASTSSVQTEDFTWNTNTSTQLSDGTFDYIYGDNANVPIAQIDTGDSVTSELLCGTNTDVKGIVEVSADADHPDTLANYTDYDSYGNPITASGGSLNDGGLTINGMSADPDSSTKFGFAGGYEDLSGLIYFVNRYYSPMLGQFLSVDPDISSTGLAFAYVTDAPTRFVDYLGLDNDEVDRWIEGEGGTGYPGVGAAEEIPPEYGPGPGEDPPPIVTVSEITYSPEVKAQIKAQGYTPPKLNGVHSDDFASRISKITSRSKISFERKLSGNAFQFYDERGQALHDADFAELTKGGTSVPRPPGRERFLLWGGPDFDGYRVDSFPAEHGGAPSIKIYQHGGPKWVIRYTG